MRRKTKQRKRRRNSLLGDFVLFYYYYYFHHMSLTVSAIENTQKKRSILWLVEPLCFLFFFAICALSLIRRVTALVGVVQQHKAILQRKKKKEDDSFTLEKSTRMRPFALSVLHFTLNSPPPLIGALFPLPSQTAAKEESKRVQCIGDCKRNARAADSMRHPLPFTPLFLCFCVCVLRCDTHRLGGCKASGVIQSWLTQRLKTTKRNKRIERNMEAVAVTRPSFKRVVPKHYDDFFPHPARGHKKALTLRHEGTGGENNKTQKRARMDRKERCIREATPASKNRIRGEHVEARKEEGKTDDNVSFTA
jgi:hypothetical protein